MTLPSAETGGASGVIPTTRSGAARLFVVVDDSPASARAISYLIRLFTDSKFRGISFCLAYVMPSLPAKLLESGGTENAEREKKLSARLMREQAEWAATTERAPSQWLTRARGRLRRAGARPASIDTCLSSPRDLRAPAEEVCILAREHACGTIVVGHHAHSWFGGGRLAEHLIRDAKGFAVWVID